MEAEMSQKNLVLEDACILKKNPLKHKGNICQKFNSFFKFNKNLLCCNIYNNIFINIFVSFLVFECHINIFRKTDMHYNFKILNFMDNSKF